jgi:murein DD-endopeptidase MepM/ murein hydrolase activator NlpD
MTLLALPTVSTNNPAGPSITDLPREAAGPAEAGAVWPIPQATVITAFEPSQPYGPGHRGVDLAAAPGQSILAALAGRVTVAGFVAGRPLIVIEHGDGLRTTYLPVAATVSVGDHVERGEPIGVLATPDREGLAGALSHCTGMTCLHWGARVGERYIDPRSLLGLTQGPIVLLPEP